MRIHERRRIMKTNTANQITVEIPNYNSRDVEFLHELEKAHDNDSLKGIGEGIEEAFNNRVEYEFLGKDINAKTRAEITNFCVYLLSIAKFYGYALPISGLTASVHNDVFSIRTFPSTRMSALVEATFTYFDEQGNYKLTASGFMRRDWATAPNDPVNRRLQIKRDNNDTLPGLNGSADSKYHIHIEIEKQFPLLVLPV
jgi:hypothetical protein